MSPLSLSPSIHQESPQIPQTHSLHVTPIEHEQDSTNPFHVLVKDMSDLLGQGGIDSKDVNPEAILDLMRSYISKKEDWTTSTTRWSADGEPYVRNLVDTGNGQYNLLLLVWRPGAESLIHDHTKHCCMKMLQGGLKETLYAFPDRRLLQSGANAPPEVKRETLMQENGVSYITNSIGLHKMTNPDSDNYAVSLHLYTPPAKVCQTFDDKTGQSTSYKLGL